MITKLKNCCLLLALLLISTSLWAAPTLTVTPDSYDKQPGEVVQLAVNYHGGGTNYFALNFTLNLNAQYRV